MKSLAPLRQLLFWLLVLGAVVPAGADNSRVKINPQDRRAEIRAELLKYTPLGSSSKDVIGFIQTRLLKKGDSAPKIRDHGATGPSAEGAKNKGVKIIKLDLGDYLMNPILLTLSPPLPFHESLMAQWAFDDKDKLVELFLDRKFEEP